MKLLDNPSNQHWIKKTRTGIKNQSREPIIPIVKLYLKLQC